MCDSEPDDDGDPIAGRTIDATRPMTDEELDREEA